jgi:hypothetical protein
MKPPRITLDPNGNAIINIEDVPQELQQPAKDAHAINRPYYAKLGQFTAKVVFPSIPAPVAKGKPGRPKKNHVAP